MADERETCKKSYDRLRSMVQGVGPNDTARIGARCSTWTNPTGVQWSEVNKIVDKDMVKSIWRGVPTNDNISKDRESIWMSWVNLCIIKIVPYDLRRYYIVIL